MRYQTRSSLEQWGGLELRIEALASLDQTIDLLFEELKRTGDERLLEDLCPYFGKVWPAARGLAEHLALHPLEGRTLLEVGCGLALPSLLAARKGARVVATDFHPDVPAFLELNLKANALTPAQLEYRALDWRKPGALTEPFEWIVGSDILYEKQHALEVAQALDALATEGTQIVVADPGRSYLQAYESQMRALGWRTQTHVYRVAEPSDSAPSVQPIPQRDVFVLHFNREGE
jgi:predicted nicotinamide N-methyase